MIDFNLYKQIRGFKCVYFKFDSYINSGSNTDDNYTYISLIFNYSSFAW